MDTIIEIDGMELQALVAILKQPGVHTLRVGIDGHNAKFKVNHTMWSPPLGHLDPQCKAADHRSYPSDAELDAAGIVPEGFHPEADNDT
jgi:hypothetical protein